MMPITISSTNVNLVHLLATSLREGEAYSTFQNRIIYKPGNFVYKVGLEIDFLVSVLQCLEKREDYCRSLIKVKFPTDQFRPALGSCCRLIVNHAQKTSKLPYFRLFRPIPKYFLPLLPYTDLVPPSTDPVPPSTNQYRRILTQYHHGSTITALY